MPINSRRKGKIIELAAAKYLTKLGYPTIRGQQRAGIQEADLAPKDANDPHIHERIHFEVKGNEAIDVGTKALADAVVQAIEDAKAQHRGKKPVVLWKKNRTKWRLSFVDGRGEIVTYGEQSIPRLLKEWMR